MADCGTDNGYKQHRARGEDACDACKAAHTLYNKRSEKTRAARLAYDRLHRKAMRMLRDRRPHDYAAILRELRRSRDGKER